MLCRAARGVAWVGGENQLGHPLVMMAVNESQLTCFRPFLLAFDAFKRRLYALIRQNSSGDTAQRAAGKQLDLW